MPHEVGPASHHLASAAYHVVFQLIAHSDDAQIFLINLNMSSRKMAYFIQHFLNDMFKFIKKNDIVNYVDDNTINVIESSQQVVVQTLQIESKAALYWFTSNEMLTNCLYNCMIILGLYPQLVSLRSLSKFNRLFVWILPFLYLIES